MKFYLKPTTKIICTILCVLITGMVWLNFVNIKNPGPDEEYSHPDLILVNGQIYTENNTDRVVQAVAIKDHIIVAVGSAAKIEALAGKNTERIDLHNHMVTPGLLDSHAHFSSTPMAKPNQLDVGFPNVRSIADVRKLIAEKVKEVKPGEWITGHGWDEGKLKEDRFITAADINDVAPNNPVWLESTMGHYGTANRQALKKAHIDANTPNPPNGIIKKDKEGDPTGVIMEDAQQLVEHLVPSPTVEDEVQGLTKLIKKANEEGMTGIKDPILSVTSWKAYKKMLKDGTLTFRVFGLWLGGKSKQAMAHTIKKVKNMPAQYQRGKYHLAAGGIKLFADGSGGGRTAWVYEPWHVNRFEIDSVNNAPNYGIPRVNPDTLKAMIRMGVDAGVHLSIHNIGDRATDNVVKDYLLALQANPNKKNLRLGLIHIEAPSNETLDIMQRCQRKYNSCYPETQAKFMWWIGDTYAANWGPKRSKRFMPLATYEKMGIKWAGGSDYSVTPFPARYELWASVARKTRLCRYGCYPFGTAEAASVKAALKASTIWSAHQMFMDDKIGSIEVGKYADLAVWDRNIFKVPTAKIKGMKCLMTLFNGKVVYRSEDFK